MSTITVPAVEVRRNDVIVATNARVQWASADSTSVTIHTTNGEFHLRVSDPVNIIRK